jgi:threonine synthase
MTTPTYVSTRGSAPELDFEAVTLAGLARDGGLYVPSHIPQLSADDLRALRGLSYVETAVRVLHPFMKGALNEDALRALLTEAYRDFAHSAMAPLVQLDAQSWVLELFHGPTLAFKDFALQVLGLLFERFLGATDKKLTVVGATSGDTGSAAIHALAGRDNIDIFMLHPHGRVSDVQRRQMTTVNAPNVFNIAIDGTFDDAQNLVKAMFNDIAFRDELNLGAVNSINWTRILVQVVYYVYAAVRLGAPERPVIFSVPTGNFGDVYAGSIARAMGVPIERLIVATNANDILHRAMSAGDYSTSKVVVTSSPSMDIQISSNFERLLFDVSGRDGAGVASALASLGTTGTLPLPDVWRAKMAEIFLSARADEDETAYTLRRVYDSCGYVLDPHTATGVSAVRQLNLPRDIPVVTLATAHPGKFRDAVERATGYRPTLPTRAQGLFDRTEKFDRVENDLAVVQKYISSRCAVLGSQNLILTRHPSESRDPSTLRD